MIYTNEKLTSEEREFDFGKISQVSMGEHGRGRKLMAFTCPDDTQLKEGINRYYSIGLTKSGKPRINAYDDGHLYMLLSSHGGYTRRGNGYVYMPESQKNDYQTLAIGNGADGDAGRIGSWDVCALKCPDNGCVMVNRSGGSSSPWEFYVINDNKVYKCDITNVAECYEALGEDMPFTVTTDKYNSPALDRNEWSCVNRLTPVEEIKQDMAGNATKIYDPDAEKHAAEKAAQKAEQERQQAEKEAREAQEKEEIRIKREEDVKEVMPIIEEIRKYVPDFRFEAEESAFYLGRQGYGYGWDMVEKAKEVLEGEQKLAQGKEKYLESFREIKENSPFKDNIIIGDRDVTFCRTLKDSSGEFYVEDANYGRGLKFEYSDVGYLNFVNALREQQKTLDKAMQEAKTQEARMALKNRENEAKEAGYPTLEFWHRVGGVISQGDTFVINSDGLTRAPDYNNLENQNHVYKYSNWLEDADGHQGWQMLPGDAVIHYDKMDRKSPFVVTLEWCEKPLTEAQKDCIAEVIEGLKQRADVVDKDYEGIEDPYKWANEAFRDYAEERGIETVEPFSEVRLNNLCAGISFSNEQKEQISLAIEHGLSDEVIQETLLDDTLNPEDMERRRKCAEYQQEQNDNEKDLETVHKPIYKSVKVHEEEDAYTYTFLAKDKDIDFSQSLKDAALEYYSSKEGYERLQSRGYFDFNQAGLTIGDILNTPEDIMEKHGLECINPTIEIESGWCNTIIPDKDLENAIKERQSDISYDFD